MNQVQLSPDQRRAVIVDAGVALATKHGLCKVRHIMVADACDPATSFATVRRYFFTNNDLWTAIANASTDEVVKAEAARLGLI